MKLLVAILLLFLTTFLHAQRAKRVDSLGKVKTQLVQAFLNLSPSDSIADIGTGAGYSLIPIANHCPSCKFSVQDIDSSTCNPAVFTKKIAQTGHLTRIENFTFYYGTETATQLPSAAFNKVLIFDVIHELTYKADMLRDIKRILSPNGSVFIEEILVHQPVKKDRICNYPFLTEAAFKQLLADNHWVIKKEQITFDTGKNKYFKMFECMPAQ